MGVMGCEARVTLTHMDREVLFLCTGNYYRSRFAEMYFNARAARAGVKWRAVSRGIATELGAELPGSVSPLVIDRLAALGLGSAADTRTPLQLQEEALAAADLVIALDETEHPPLMRQRFDAWVDRITYWDVPDAHLLNTEDALVRIADRVDALLQQLGAGSPA
jgi:protein-tyrosine phosphatase